MTRTIDNILDRYNVLLGEVDLWFNRCQATFPEQIRCGKGCSGCCRSLFDITLLDAWQIRRGFIRLSQAQQQEISDRAVARLAVMHRFWPEFAPPYLLNYRPEVDWQLLMPDDDEAPCVFLDVTGRCLVYEHRPMTCRLHGLPLVDVSGEIMYEEWCTDNFPNDDPLAIPQLRAAFDELFRNEVKQMQQLTVSLFEHGLGELDTFIPLAALVDYDRFNWRNWWTEVELIENNQV